MRIRLLTAIVSLALTHGAMTLVGYWVGRATSRPRPCPACASVDLAPVRGDLDQIGARLDHLDARCVLLPERDRLAVVAAPKKAVP